MSTALIASARNSASNAVTAFDAAQPVQSVQSSSDATRTGRKGPVVWGERSASRSQHAIRPGQRARVSRATSSSDRGFGLASDLKVRSDRSRPSPKQLSYGRPSVAVSAADRPMRRDISGGKNLTRMVVAWALALGTAFGVYGSIVFEAGEQEIADASFTPTYASYSAE